MKIIKKRTYKKPALAAIVLAAAVFLFITYEGYFWPNNLFAAGYKIKGIDVSSHQKSIDWQAVAKSGKVRFAYIKATEGADFHDQRFTANWEGAAITVGAYHYFVLTSTGKAQAANFIGAVPGQAGTLPPAIDIEINIPDRAGFERQLTDFISAVTKHYNQKPILYTTYKDYGLLRDGFKGYTVWIRDIVRPPSADGWSIWQYCDRVRVSGIKGPIDLDAYYASEKDFGEMLSK